MGKRFGGDASGKFVNGVLGTLYKTLEPEVEEKVDEGTTEIAPNNQSEESNLEDTKAE